MSSSPKSKSESESLHLLEESNSDPKVNNNVAKKTTLIVQCEVVRRRSPRLSPSQGFRRSPRLSSDRGKSEKPPPPPPRRRSSTSTSRFASPRLEAFNVDEVEILRGMSNLIGEVEIWQWQSWKSRFPLPFVIAPLIYRCICYCHGPTNQEFDRSDRETL